MARVLAIETCPAQHEALYRRLQAEHHHEVSAFSAADRGVAEGIWQCRPEVILFSGYASRFVRGAMAQLALVPIPWVLRSHTSDHARPRSRLKNLARDALLRALYARTSALTYIGQRSRRHYQRLGVAPRKLFFAPCGVDSELFQASESDRVRMRDLCRHGLQIPERRVLLLVCGALTTQQDPTRPVHALRALPGLLRQRVTLLFVGEGELAPELTRLALVEPRVDVRLLGAKKASELSAHYHAADAVVLSSCWGEAWGPVANEALHHGTPCIVSHQVGCAPDLIVPGETGEVFEAGNAESLARAIERIWPRLGTRACRDQARTRSAGYSVAAAVSGLSDAIAYAAGGRMFAFR